VFEIGGGGLLLIMELMGG
jgi:hypothetical protein